MSTPIASFERPCHTCAADLQGSVSKRIERHPAGSTAKTSQVAALIIASLAAIFIGIPILKFAVFLLCGFGLLSLFSRAEEAWKNGNLQAKGFSLYGRGVSMMKNI